jgi:hypothetical protein
MCTCMRPTLRHCDRQIALPASALTHAHATTASTRPRASQQIQPLMTPGTGRRPITRGTHTSPIIRSTQRVLRGDSSGTQRILSRGLGCARRRRRRWVCRGHIREHLSMHIYRKRYRTSDTHRRAAGVRGTQGKHRSSVWRWSARGLGPKWTQLHEAHARDPMSMPRVRREYPSSTPRVPREYTMSTP